MAPIFDTQGTYDSGMAVAYAGMLAEGQAARDVASKIVTTAAVPFGRAVGVGSADGTCRMGGTGYVGITVADKSRDEDEFDVGELAAVLRKGTIWVAVTVAVADTDTVYFVPATGVITNVSTDNTAIPGARFETTTAGAGLARVYLG
jgi:hypothetical protein